MKFFFWNFQNMRRLKQIIVVFLQCGKMIYCYNCISFFLFPALYPILLYSLVFSLFSFFLPLNSLCHLFSFTPSFLSSIHSLCGLLAFFYPLLPFSAVSFLSIFQLFRLAFFSLLFVFMMSSFF